MKSYIKSMVILLMSAMLLSSCIEDPAEIGDPFDRVSGLSGTWQLEKIVQNDEDAIRKGFPSFAQSLDITALMPFANYQLVLNVGEEGSPTTYEVTDGGAPNFIGSTSGTWSLDDPTKPASISFQNGETFTIETYLGLTEGLMTLKFTRNDSEGQSFLSYEYEFVKQ